METIIGLLVILLPLIFKLIGRKLEQSAKQEKASSVLESADVFDRDEAPEDVLEHSSWEMSVEIEQEQPLPAPASAEKIVPPVQEGTPVVKKKPILLEEEQTRKGEKIDPKKLVIYSEIMKTKF